MQDKMAIVRRYFTLLETFNTEPSDFLKVLHRDFVQTEFPNLMNKELRERGIEGCIKGALMGKKILSFQRLEATKQYESGDNNLIVEAVWTAKVSVAAGTLKKDQPLKAYICMIFEFKEGKIVGQRNYDCYGNALS